MYSLFSTSQLFGDKEVPGDELHEILREIDTNMNGQVELDEYLQVCCIAHAQSVSGAFITHSVSLLFTLRQSTFLVKFLNGDYYFISYHNFKRY